MKAFYWELETVELLDYFGVPYLAKRVKQPPVISRSAILKSLSDSQTAFNNEIIKRFPNRKGDWLPLNQSWIERQIDKQQTSDEK